MRKKKIGKKRQQQETSKKEKKNKHFIKVANDEENMWMESEEYATRKNK